MRGLGRGGSLNLVGAVCQQVCLLSVTVLIARFLGQGALGEYVLCYAVLTLTSLGALFGFRAAMIRYVAMHLADEDPDRVRGTIRFAVSVSGAIALVVGMLIMVFAPQLTELFNLPRGSDGFLFVGATLPAFTLRDLALSATQGWRTQRPFALIGWIMEPLLRLGITATALAFGAGVDGAFVALLTASWLAALAALRSLWTRLRRLPPGQVAVDRGPILRFAVVSFGNVIAGNGLIWADTLILGALADPAELGVYVVATRIVGLAVFVMAPFDALFSPHFAHQYHVGDRSGLARTYTMATTGILRLSLPAFVVLTIMPGRLLDLFGSGFDAGVKVTLLLAVGQLVNAATGPCGSLLTMAGRLSLNMAINTAGLVLNIALNVLLIPAYGITGAGIAWSVSLIAINLSKLYVVHRTLAMTPFGLGSVKALVSAVASAGVGWTTLQVVPEGLPGTVLAGLSVGIGYLLVSAVLRLSEDEQEVLRGVLGRGKKPVGDAQPV